MRKQEEINKAVEALESRNFPRAKKILRTLARQGDASAKCNLGIMYLNGDGGTANPSKAKKYFLDASGQECIDADYYLGVMYEQGFPGVNKDEREAKKYFRKVAAVRPNGYKDTHYRLGAMCEEGRGGDKDEEQAMEYFSMVTSQKDRHDKYKEAQYRLGIMYAEGRGVKRNKVQARGFLMNAAKESHKGAQFYLGMLFVTGGEIAVDEAEAMMWFNKAAAEPEGHTEAQYYLGVIYEEGHIGSKGKKDYKGYKDESKARIYFLQAAQSGHKEAQYRLAVMYEQGRGGDQNDAEAMNWFIKAASQGKKEAESRLKGYASVSGVGAENTSKEVPKLIEVAKQVSGDDYEKNFLITSTRTNSDETIGNNTSSSDSDILGPSPEIKVFSPKGERRVSRIGNLLGVLSLRQGQAPSSLDNPVKLSAVSEDIHGRKENAAVDAVDGRSPGLADDRMVPSSRRVPARTPSLTLKKEVNKDSDVNSGGVHFAPAQSYDGISRFSGPLSGLSESGVKLSSCRDPGPAYSLPLDDNRKIGHSPLAESSDSINRFKRSASPLNSFFEGRDRARHKHGPAPSLSVEGKADKSANEYSNRGGGNFGLFKLPSPKMRRPTKGAGNINSIPSSLGGKLGPQ